MQKESDLHDSKIVINVFEKLFNMYVLYGAKLIVM